MGKLLVFDVSRELNAFYDTHIRLGDELRKDLGGYRDLNLQRLNDGLAALGEKMGTTYRTYVDTKNQGSYAMHTLNQCEHTDYDIDVAVIFEKDDLPGDAAAARQRVRDALLEKCTNFTKEPEARKNAVTVWYADGYHIDFAVYRRTKDWWGNVLIEHAGGDAWTERDPMQYTDWFVKQVSNKSPAALGLFSLTVSVPKQQLRRITRLVKAFARSRSSWSLPGGIIISTLVCEAYQSHPARDDLALANTLKALLARLQASLDVANPVQPGSYFTSSERRRKEVERLRDCLEEKLPALDALYDTDCTRQQALGAWNTVFNHNFWSAQKQASDQSALSSVGLECWLAKSKGGSVFRQHRSDSVALPKGVHLRFTAKPDGLAGPYSVRWSVRNEGHEATDAGQLSHDQTLTGDVAYWTSTAFKGRQKMICEVLQNGMAVRQAEHLVRIGPSR